MWKVKMEGSLRSDFYDVDLFMAWIQPPWSPSFVTGACLVTWQAFLYCAPSVVAPPPSPLSLSHCCLLVRSLIPPHVRVSMCLYVGNDNDDGNSFCTRTKNLFAGLGVDATVYELDQMGESPNPKRFRAPLPVRVTVERGSSRNPPTPVGICHGYRLLCARWWWWWASNGLCAACFAVICVRSYVLTVGVKLATIIGLSSPICFSNIFCCGKERPHAMHIAQP